ncbi:MAG: SurA N-terminal domain-containing protein [Spirochaetia bacterium]|nr:SurA N-terminal domain-containing protein [Spirochaetia bacterium]
MKQALVILLIAMLACRSGEKKAEEKPAKAEAKVTVKPVTLSARGEALNRVRIIVGEEPITEMDIEQMKKNMLRMGKPIRNLQEDAVNELIRRAIVENEARNESIIVSETRIENEVNRAKDNAGVRDEARFKAMVEQDSGMPYSLWVDSLKYDLMKQQLIQIKISVPQPSSEELKRYYAQNAGRAGMEVRYREIVLQPQNGTLEEEARISQLARQIAERSRGSVQAFADLARSTPDNVSPAKMYGGQLDYASLSEVAANDRITAGVLSNLGVGQVSSPYRDTRGRYVLLMLEDRRPVAFDKIEDRIRQRMFFEKAEQAFEEWVVKQRKETAITRLD